MRTTLTFNLFRRAFKRPQPEPIPVLAEPNQTKPNQTRKERELPNTKAEFMTKCSCHTTSHGHIHHRRHVYTKRVVTLPLKANGLTWTPYLCSRSRSSVRGGEGGDMSTRLHTRHLLPFFTFLSMTKTDSHGLVWWDAKTADLFLEKKKEKKKSGSKLTNVLPSFAVAFLSPDPSAVPPTTFPFPGGVLPIFIPLPVPPGLPKTKRSSSWAP